MISRTVKVQLLIFVLISVLGIIYAGFSYVGIRSVGPLRLQADPYKVSVQLPSSGGIFPNALVTDRGYTVGKVDALQLDGDGVKAILAIDHNRKIPADVTAQVANLSAVGEQYIDLTPQSDSGPYLKNGSVIPRSRAAVPVDDATLLLNLDKLVNSVDRQNLQTVIAELGKSFDHTGPDLQRLIDEGNNLLVSAQAALPQTLTLINDGRTTLQTQRDVSGDLRSFSSNLNLLSQQFVASDPDVRRLFDNGVASAQTLQAAISENSSDLGVLAGNLVTLGQINVVRLPAIEQTLILYPLNVANGFLGARDGVAQFGAVTTTAPTDCTSGYQSTKHRSERAGNPAYGLGGPANLNTLCQAPDQAGQGAGASEARGAYLAPRPPGDTTATRGGAVGTTGSNSQPSYAFAGYDSQGRFSGPNGKAYSLGNAAAQSQAFGPTSWQYLLAANAAN